MDLSLSTVVPPINVEPTMMFSYPTCAADVYTPRIEQIYLPGKEDVPELPVEIKVATNYTWAVQLTSWKWKFIEQAVKLSGHKKAIDYTGRFIYDARNEADKNVAHLLENSCTYALLAKKLLSEHLGRAVEVTVILKKNVPAFARELFDSLGIPILCTNLEVYGEVVEVVHNYNYRLYNIQAELFNIELKDYNPNTPERVFIPRRGSRQLINNDEVVNFLKERGFTTYYFEDLTASEKWSIARNAKIVVSVHGAGTGNFIFNRLGLAPQAEKGSGLRLIELLSPSFTIHTYRQFGTILNGKWCGVRGQITPEVLRYLDFDTRPRNTLKSPIRDPFKIDLSSLQMALDFMAVDQVKLPSEELAPKGVEVG